MRLSDLIESTTEQDDLLGNLEEMIVRAKARGFSQMSTPTVLAKLESMGYVLEMENLLELLSTITSVGAANREVIKLDNALPPSPENNEEGKKIVQKMASKQLMKDRKP